MMGFLVALVLALLGIFLNYRRKRWISPDVLFCYQWALISFLASLQLYGLFEASSFTWIVILIGSVSFVIGVGTFVPMSKHLRIHTMQATIPFFNKRTFWLLLILIYLLSIQDFLQSLHYMAIGYSLKDLRNASYGIEEISGYERNVGGIYAIYSSIKELFKLLTITVGIHYFSMAPTKNFKYIVAVTGLVLMASFTNGGRFGLAYIIIEIIICFSFFKGQFTKTSGKTLIYLVVAFVLSFVIIISFQRGWETEDLGPKYYRYLCGNIVFFDRHLIKITDLSPVYLIWNSFYGLWSLVLPVFHALIGLPYPDSYLQAIQDTLATQEYELIGEDMNTNAFITPFYHLYVDGRIPGVIIGMFILGAFMGKVYKNAVEKCSGRNIAYYLIICQMLFQTISLYPFVAIGYVSVVIFFMLYRNKTLNIVNDVRAT